MKHIIIGSSVACYGIDPAYLPDSAYNLAIARQWPRYNKAQLEKYMDYLPNLKSVIWGIAYQTLWEEYEKDDEDIIYYNIYMDIHVDNNILYQSEILSCGRSSLRKCLKYYLRRKKTMYCDTLGLDYTCKLSEKKKIRINGLTVYLEISTYTRD
ncbi:MAG: hypothetical protein LBF17_05565 [Mediterranea sp.]|nr:hypothetical protein [Mediterranea sp.]